MVDDVVDVADVMFEQATSFTVSVVSKKLIYGHRCMFYTKIRKILCTVSKAKSFDGLQLTFIWTP